MQSKTARRLHCFESMNYTFSRGHKKANDTIGYPASTPVNWAYLRLSEHIQDCFNGGIPPNHQQKQTDNGED